MIRLFVGDDPDFNTETFQKIGQRRPGKRETGGVARPQITEYVEQHRFVGNIPISITEFDKCIFSPVYQFHLSDLAVKTARFC